MLFIMKKNSLFKNRSKARILCVEALYQYDHKGIENKEDLIALKWISGSNPPNEQTKEYYFFLIQGVFENLEKIDMEIQLASKYGDKKVLMKIDRAILRFAVFSLLFEKDLAINILIDEAIKIAKEYGGVNAYQFINGILDSIYKKQSS